VLSRSNLPTDEPWVLTCLVILAAKVFGWSHAWCVAYEIFLVILWTLILLCKFNERPVKIQNLRTWRDR
jgi:hypothetical protein